MAANIWGERFLGARQPAWHGLGTVYDPATDPITASEAISRTKLDYTVHKVPVTIPTQWGDLADGKRVALVREPVADDPEARVFGFAGADYEVVQNATLGRMLDGLSRTWPVETVGALGKGETIFMALDAGTFQVGGEDVRQFFTIADWKTGERALQALITPVRVVCQNTLMTGIAAATVRIQLSHGKGLLNELDFRLALMAQLTDSAERVKAAMGLLTRASVVEAQVAQIINAAYPLPGTPGRVQTVEQLKDLDITFDIEGAVGKKYASQVTSHQQDTERVLAFRAAATERYHVLNDEHPAVARTAWAAYNAVTETSNYRKGAGGALGERNAMAGVLFGDRAREMARAFKVATAIASAS